MTETLTYEIEKKDGDFEIRRYGEHVVAHVDVEAPFDEAMGIGFRILAHYIFGGN
ncbi:MAG: heme-binding protein, partial [Methanobacterium sp.]